MKFSHAWLEELSGVKMKPEIMAELLSLHAFEAQVGEKKAKDTILEVDILPNRASEGYSHVCVAREIAALKNRRFKLPILKVQEDKKMKAQDILGVNVKDTKLCPRYCARVISGVKIKESPEWLKKRLIVLGLNPINNIVDATNYVMLEMGQPLHAFDADKINGSTKKEIIVRTSKKGEHVTTLSNQKIELPFGSLVIADAKKILAIAGIKGAVGAEITSKTKNIILEAANFKGEHIRAVSKAIGIDTDSSVRFSKNLSSELAAIALERVAFLIKKIAGGKIYSGVIESYPRKLVPAKVFFPFERITELLGATISKNDAISVLNRLGFEARAINIYKKIPELIEFSKKFIGKKYKYGASTTFDAPELFDCSSFVKYLYRHIGFELPRTSIEQAEIGRKVSLDKLLPGDLVFTDGSKAHSNNRLKDIGHVALFIGDGKVIHASGDAKKVVIGSLRDVANAKKFRVARRPIDDSYDKDALEITVPATRFDMWQAASLGSVVWRDVDIIEEIGRIFGFQKIKPIMPQNILMPVFVSEGFQWKKVLENLFSSLGFSEIYTFAVYGEKDLDVFSIKQSDLIVLQNPLSEEVKYLRHSLIPGIIKAAYSNLKNFSEFKLFEAGSVYQWGTGKKYEHEKNMVAGAIVSSRKAEVLFYEMKGMLESIFQQAGINEVWFDEVQNSINKKNNAWWSLAHTAEIKSGDDVLGFFGVVDSGLLSRVGIDKSIVAFEINFEAFLKYATQDKRYREIPKFPSIVRDISILAPDNVKIDDMLNSIETAGGVLLEDTDIVDIYEGDEMEEGMQSVTFRMVFRSKERTLQDKEVNAIVDKVQKTVKEQGWHIR